jgi:hypothetical protein
MGAVDRQSAVVASAHEPCVPFRVGRVPPAGPSIGDPETFVVFVAAKRNDEVYVRIDRLAVFELNGLVELELDGSVAREVQGESRVPGVPDARLMNEAKVW